jgi:FKBP-type peptidyl-prolyl cis-trans isomerase
MQFVKNGLYALSLVLLVAACDSVDFKKTKAGVPYKVFSEGSGNKIKVGDFVKFNVTLKVGDSIMATSYGKMPDYIKVEPADSAYDWRAALTEALPNAKKGDSIYIVQALDTFINRNPELAKDTFFKKGKQLVTTVRIVDVFTSEETARADAERESMSSFLKDPQVKTQMAADHKVITDHLAQNNINAKKTDWGTFIQVIEPGQGPSPTPGKFASVRYRGTDLQGKQFDSNMEPGKPVYPLQIGSRSSIPGFEDGIRQLKKGGKARIFVPSVLGYGPQGSPPRIAPNQVLVFDIEVVDVTDEQPAPPMPQQPNIDTTRNRR